MGRPWTGRGDAAASTRIVRGVRAFRDHPPQALSGDGKTLLFVNLSPTTASANESLCSLRFAKQVNQVELGKAKKNVEMMD